MESKSRVPGVIRLNPSDFPPISSRKTQSKSQSQYQNKHPNQISQSTSHRDSEINESSRKNAPQNQSSQSASLSQRSSQISETCAKNVAQTDMSSSDIKKKKKKAPKEVRKRRREEAALNAKFGPKDSHIHMISNSVLEAIKRDSLSNNNSKSTQNYVANLSNLIEVPIASTSQNATVNSSLSRPLYHLSEYPQLRGDTSKDLNSTLKIKPISYKFALTSPAKPAAPAAAQENEGWETEAEPLENREETTIKHLGSAEVILSKKKPSKNPVLISLGDAIVKQSTPSKQKLKKSTIKSIISEKFQTPAGNLLDSSVVVTHKGKMRFGSKKKKRPTKLKKAILQTRALKKAEAQQKLILNAASISNIEQKITIEIVNESHLQNQDLENSNSNELVEVEKNDQFRCQETENICEKKDKTSLEFLPDSNHENLVDESQNQELINSKFENNLNDEEDLYNCCETNLSLVSSNSNLKKAADQDDLIKKLFENIDKSSSSASQKSVPEAKEPDLDKLKLSPHIIAQVKSGMKHSRKFKPYCDMYISKELHGIVISLMSELFRFQDRLYHTNPMKFNMSRRFIHGIKDALMLLKLNKIVCLIIAADIESNSAEGGLDEKVEELISRAKESGVRIVFSGSRYYLGKPMRVKSHVSVIGILNYQGTEEIYTKLMDLTNKLRGEYDSDFDKIYNELLKEGKIIL